MSQLNRYTGSVCRWNAQDWYYGCDQLWTHLTTQPWLLLDCSDQGETQILEEVKPSCPEQNSLQQFVAGNEGERIAWTQQTLSYDAVLRAWAARLRDTWAGLFVKKIWPIPSPWSEKVNVNGNVTLSVEGGKNMPWKIGFLKESCVHSHNYLTGGQRAGKQPHWTVRISQK